jgi:hypothetical protein
MKSRLHPPEVILDVVFDRGQLFIVIVNIGDLPALKVSVSFDRKFRGVDGNKEMSSLPVFRNIEFLSPHKEIRIFLDMSALYFRRKEPTKLTATVSYRDWEKATYERTIRHDIGIYKSIGYPGETTPVHDPAITKQ